MIGQSIKYSLRVYLTGCVLAPFLFLFIDDWTKSGQATSGLGFFTFIALMGIFIAAGLIYALPGIILLWLSTLLLNKTDISTALKKVLLILLIAGLIKITFYIFLRYGDQQLQTELSIAYFSTISLSILPYRLQKKHPASPTQPDNI